MGSSTGRWQDVTPQNPCPVCGHGDFCTRATDGRTILCRREPCWGDRAGKHGVDDLGDRWSYAIRDGSDFGHPASPSAVAPEGARCADEATRDRVYRYLLETLPLAAEHRDQLRARGIPDGEINARQYRSLGRGRARYARSVLARIGGGDGDQAAADLLATVPGFYVHAAETSQGPTAQPYWSIAGQSGLLIPSRDLEGRILALKIRMDNPPAPTAKGQPAAAQGRYLTLSSTAHGGPGPGAHVHVPLRAGAVAGAAGGRVRLTEGELKADVATAIDPEHIPTLSVPGVGTWRRALDVIRTMGARVVRLAFDADAATNWRVAGALERAARALADAGFALELETWDGTAAKGIDDAMLAGIVRSVLTGNETVIREAQRLREAALASRTDAAPTAPAKDAPAPSSAAAATPTPTSVPQPSGQDVRPALDVGEGDLHALVLCAWRLLDRRNDPPRLYRSAAGLTYIGRTSHGDRVLVRHSLDSLRLAVAGMIRCEQWSKSSGRMDPKPPPDLLVKSLLATDSPPLPIVNRVVEVPVFAADGSLLTRRGYHPGSQTFYDPPEGLDIPDVPERPTAADVAASLALLLEPIRDFPFVGQAEVAHALSALLLPFARELIAGPTPLHLVVKPTPGTGAGLLCDVIATLTTGRRAAPMAEARDEDEQRKRLTSALLEGHEILLLDNLSRIVAGAPLAVALTADTWTDRLLGSSSTVRAPIRCLWLATGNNVQTSTEMARRIVRIRLDAHMERPHERPVTTFRHPALIDWVREKRGEMVAAALTLIRAWVVAGRPSGARTLGSYESWAAVIGGVLDVAGVPGFLGNLDDWSREADVEGGTLRDFVQAWWDRHGSREVGVGDLFPVADDRLNLGDGGDRSRRTRLGAKLAQLRDRVFGSLRVEAGALRHQARMWRLVELSDDAGESGGSVVDGLFPGNLGGTWGTSGEPRFPSQSRDFTSESRKGEPGEPFSGSARVIAPSRACAHAYGVGKGSPGSPESSEEARNSTEHQPNRPGEPRGNLGREVPRATDDGMEEIVV